MNIRQYTLWMVWSRWDGCDLWIPCHWTVAYTRTHSIKKFDADIAHRTNKYAARRRRGLVKCVRVRIVPEDPSTLPGRTAEGDG